MCSCGANRDSLSMNPISGSRTTAHKREHHNIIAPISTMHLPNPVSRFRDLGNLSAASRAWIPSYTKTVQLGVRQVAIVWNRADLHTLYSGKAEDNGIGRTLQKQRVNER